MKLIFLIVTICLFFCTEARSKPEHDLTRQGEDKNRTARYVAYVKTPYRTTFVASRPRPVPYRYGRDVEEMLTRGPDGLIKEKRFVAASKKPFVTTVVTGNHRNVRSAEDNDRTARYVAYVKTPYRTTFVASRPRPVPYRYGRDVEEMLTRGPDGLIKEKRFDAASKKPFVTTVVTGNDRNVRSAKDTDRTARYVAYSSTPYKKVVVVTRPYKYSRSAGRAYVFGRDAEEMLTRGPDGLIKEKRFVVASKKPFTTTVVAGKPYRG